MPGASTPRGHRWAALTTALVLLLGVAALLALAAAVSHRPAMARPVVAARALATTTSSGPDVVAPDQPRPAARVRRPGPDRALHLFLRGRALPPAADLGAGLREDVGWVQGGRLRSYRLVIPRGLPGPAPVVVVLPGYRQGLGLAQRQQRWARLAVRGRFMVVYAAGYDGSWNAGLCCGTSAAHRVDDVGYLDALLTRVRATHPVDPRRIFLAGFSNGGMMAHRYACERAGTVAAIVSVAGPMETASCQPSQPVAVLQIHGLADRTVPIDGAAYEPALRARLRSAAGTVRFWQGVDGSVAPARLVVRPRLGHAWPADGTALAWAFFAAHPQR